MLCKLIDRDGKSLDPTVFLAHRQLIAALLLLPIGWCSDRAFFPFADPRWLLAGAASFSLNLECYLIGLAMTDPMTTTIMQLSIPGLGLLLGWATGTERPSRSAIGFTVLAMVACTIAVVGGAAGASENEPSALGEHGDAAGAFSILAGDAAAGANATAIPVVGVVELPSPVRFLAGVRDSLT